MAHAGYTDCVVIFNRIELQTTNRTLSYERNGWAKTTEVTGFTSKKGLVYVRLCRNNNISNLRIGSTASDARDSFLARLGCRHFCVIISVVLLRKEKNRRPITLGFCAHPWRMAEPSAATPGSSTTSKAPATKDKDCQYCHQTFTSSSLGRHLDLYIKDKNAKPPDDIHNVEEIRRLRGNVTRRQARTSSGKREGSTPSSSKPTPFRDQRSPSIQGPSAHNKLHHPDGEPIRTYLNKANWQSTGVINDLPPIADHTLYSRALSPSRRPSVKEEIIHKQNMLEERDRARAAELALKEVLENVKAAR